MAQICYSKLGHGPIKAKSKLNYNLVRDIKPPNHESCFHQFFSVLGDEKEIEQLRRPSVQLCHVT